MKKILLIDGSSLIFRAFYAIKNLTTKDGVFVNGVYGFLNMYYKALELIKPTHIFVAFDKDVYKRQDIQSLLARKRTREVFRAGGQKKPLALFFIIGS